MLSELSIQNVVLIESLTINFDQGFTSLTGETGAGKSILLDSLSLILGARADTGLIRRGTDKAQVVARFEGHIPEHMITLLDDLDIPYEQGDGLIIRRSLSSDGRSRAYINDAAVSVGALKQVGGSLIDIHSQFETHALLNPKSHRDWLDVYMDDPASIQAVRVAWEELRQVKAELSQLQEVLAKAQADQEYWQASVEELDRLDPKIGEEDDLMRARETCSAREQIMDKYQIAVECLEGENGAIPQANQAWRALDRSPQRDEEMLARMDAALQELQDIGSDLQSSMQELAHNDMSVEAIDDRLIALRAVARKHNCTCDELLDMRDDLAQRLDQVATGTDQIEQLNRAVDQARIAYIDHSEQLTQQRRKTAERLSKSIMGELTPLKLDKAVFAVQIDPCEESEWGPTGRDKIAFLIAANPGQSPAPLHKSASGGELSRIMLALKVVFAETNPVAVMIFDEIDSGMGGATADAVGDRLAALSRQCQVLAVTHSPQIASLSDAHKIVQKQEDNAGVMVTQVLNLGNMAERQEEIARMLSGAEITAEARAAAASLMNRPLKESA